MSDPLHVFTNHTDTVIARDPEDATRVWLEHLGECEGNYVHDWTRLDGDHVLGIDDENTNDATDGSPLRLTCREWIEREGRGFLCSTEY